MLFGLGSSIYAWNDPLGTLFLQTFAMIENRPKLALATRKAIHRIISGTTPRA